MLQLTALRRLCQFICSVSVFVLRVLCLCICGLVNAARPASFILNEEYWCLIVNRFRLFLYL